VSFTVQRPGVVALVALHAGFDPILNVGGSFFPSWMVCMVVGVALTAIARQLLVLARLEAYLGPPLLVYPSLAILLTVVLWVAFYRT
jgi:hypothetical protein